MKLCHTIILILVSIQNLLGQALNDQPKPNGLSFKNAAKDILDVLDNVDININIMPSPTTDQASRSVQVKTTFELISTESTQRSIPVATLAQSTTAISSSKRPIVITATTEANKATETLDTSGPLETSETTLKKTSTRQQQKTIFTSGADSLEIKALKDQNSSNTENVGESSATTESNNPILSGANRMQPIADDQDSTNDHTQTLSKDKIAIIVVSVSLIIGVFVVGLIYVGLPRFKSWRKGQMSRQKDNLGFDNVPDWQKVMETHLDKRDDMIFSLY